MRDVPPWSTFMFLRVWPFGNACWESARLSGGRLTQTRDDPGSPPVLSKLGIWPEHSPTEPQKTPGMWPEAEMKHDWGGAEHLCARRSASVRADLQIHTGRQVFRVSLVTGSDHFPQFPCGQMMVQKIKILSRIKQKNCIYFAWFLFLKHLVTTLFSDIIKEDRSTRTILISSHSGPDGLLFLVKTRNWELQASDLHLEHPQQLSAGHGLVFSVGCVHPAEDLEDLPAFLHIRHSCCNVWLSEQETCRERSSEDADQFVQWKLTISFNIWTHFITFL